MKKFLKFGAVLTALVLGLTCFAACGEEEESRSVVAEWISTDNVYSYKFYSDETYEWKERTQVIETGTYYGMSAPNKRGDLKMSKEMGYDDISGKLIPDPETYTIKILVDDNDKLYFTDVYGRYNLVN